MNQQDHRLVQVVPSERQLRLMEMEYYAFVHFGMNTATNKEWGDGTENPAWFNPARLDAAQWVQSIQAAGMTGLIFTCKHHDGFCLWPSKHTTHTIAASPYQNGRGDIVKEVAEACHQAGIGFGVYLSPWDRNHPAYGTGKEYDDDFVAQLEELLTGYGPVCSVWLDGACGEGPIGKTQYYDWQRYEATVRRLQPEACMHICGSDIRWCGNEAGQTRPSEWSVVPRRTAHTERVASLSQQSDDPSFRLRPIKAWDLDLGSRAALADEADLIWYPAEVNTSIRPGWFYHAAEDDQVRPLEELIRIYEASVGGNANFLLNIPPTPEGRFHSNDVERLRQMGDYLRSQYGHDLLPTAALGASPAAPGHDIETVRRDDETFYLPAVADGTACILIRWTEEQALGRLVMQEQLRMSQRVEHFTVEAWQDNAWVQVYEGTVIGHKRIVPLSGLRTQALRIRILDARVAPTLKRICVYADPQA